jgi:predicted transcriptional regulator
MGDEDSLKKDFVVLSMYAHGINDQQPDSRQKLLRVAEILKSQNPVNMINEMLWGLTPVIQAVYNDKNSFKEALKLLKSEDLGISITVSGLISEIKQIAEETGLKIHTVNLSLGVFGDKKLLPPQKILEVTTMCGHHCVSPNLVESLIQQVKKNKMTPEEAAEELSRPCICGVFNKSRAAELIKNMID